MQKRASDHPPCHPRCTALNHEIRHDLKDPPLAPEHFLCVWHELDPRVRRRARRMLSVLASFSMDEEDMSQELALALWEAVSKGRARAATGYLEVWATHAFGSVLRYQRRRPAMGSGGEILDEQPTSSSLVFGAYKATAEEVAGVNEILRVVAGREAGGDAELAEGDRMVLKLVLDGLAGPELAAALGTTPGAARLRLMRARARMRDFCREAA